jgi:fatty acid desaturase
MTYATNPASVAGQNGDGSKSLAKESKAGLAVAFVVTTILQALAQGLGSLDTTSWSGWWVPLATTGIGVVSGLITAYLKKNR